MKTIPIEIIDRCWEEITALDPSQMAAAMEQMSGEQPAILAFLMAGEDQDCDEASHGTLIIVGYTIWRIISSQNENLRPVAIEELEQAEEANLAFLEKFDEGPEYQQQDFVQALLASYNQAPLLQATVEALMSGDEEHSEESDENAGILLLYLKSVIDCLDQD